METPETSEAFTLPDGRLVPLRHIRTIGEVYDSPPDDSWCFTIHIQWSRPTIGIADYTAVYRTQFEAVAVRAALYAAVWQERLKESARRARLEW